MTLKDYIKIENAIQNFLITTPDVEKYADSLINSFKSELKADNPKFDGNKFMARYRGKKTGQN